MTFDAVALCRTEPDAVAILGALIAVGPDLKLNTVEPAGLMQLFDPVDGRLLLTVETTLRVRVPAEAQRLLGVSVDRSVWWVDARAPGGDPRAADLARRFTAELVALTGGDTWADPLASAGDAITSTAVVLHQNRPVVGLSPWLAEAAVDAVRGGLTLQIVTPRDSLVTYPLELMLAETRGQWVVRSGEHHRDGLTRAPLRWDGDRFSRSPAPPVGPPPVATAWSGGLELQIVTLHPATEALELGAGTEAAVRALTGAGPVGWGVTEPVTEPWSRRDLTAFCRDRAPASVSLMVAGGEPWSPVLGVLTVERVEAGVREQVRLAGPTLSAAGAAAIEGLAGKLAGTARSMVVAVHPARSGGVRSSTPTMPALPWGILVGHQENAIGSEPETVPGRAVGSGARRAWWYRVDGGPGAPYETLASVLRRYGLPDPRSRRAMDR